MKFITGQFTKHPVVPGLYLIPLKKISDYDDPQVCARCNRKIGYSRTAIMAGPQTIIHCVEYDCKDNRNW